MAVVLIIIICSIIWLIITALVGLFAYLLGVSKSMLVMTGGTDEKWQKFKDDVEEARAKMKEKKMHYEENRGWLKVVYDTAAESKEESLNVENQ